VGVPEMPDGFQSENFLVTGRKGKVILKRPHGYTDPETR
jgi:hypothetical protein